VIFTAALWAILLAAIGIFWLSTSLLGKEENEAKELRSMGISTTKKTKLGSFILALQLV